MRGLILLSFCVLALAGCRNDGPTPTPTPSPTPAAGKVVMALFDLSGSTKDNAIRQRYAESFQRVLDKAGANDVIVADAITDDPLGQSSFPINQTFPLFDPGTDNPLLVRKKQEEFDKKLQELRQQLATTAQRLLADTARRSKQTRILDATRLAERVFKTYLRQKKVLVVFSDMVEDSDRANFARQAPSETGTAKLLDEEQRAGRLPDLAGARVYVIGAAASGQPLAPASYANVEHFWLQYFKRAGADLTKERYGAALLSFDE